MSKGLQIAAGVGLVLGLLGWYAASNVRTFRYYETLAEFQVSPERGRPARVHGYVAIGSIERDVAAREVRFAVQNDPPHTGGSPDGALPVVYASLETPDLFKDGAQVVVEGELGPGAFHATNVLAKCPSKFESKARGLL